MTHTHTHPSPLEKREKGLVSCTPPLGAQAAGEMSPTQTLGTGRQEEAGAGPRVAEEAAPVRGGG